MHQRIAALAAGTVMALPLLSACGASTAPSGSSAAPAASSAAAPSATATATPSSSQADETATVRAAGEKFFKTALTLGYTDDADSYATRVKPLMTENGYAKWAAALPVDKTLATQKTKFGDRVRSSPHLVGKAKVSALTDSKATVAVTFEAQIQQRRGSSWKVVKRSVDDTAKLGLVRQDGAWLVDDLL